MADDLETYLQNLPDAVADEISIAIKAQAERLSDAQKQAAVSLMDTSVTGGLEESCMVVPGANKLEWIVQAGGQLTTYQYDRWTDYEAEVTIDGSNNRGIKKRRKGTGKAVTFDHALAFEYGTSRQHAKPFFFPTYNALRDDMQEQINEAIGKALE